MPQPKVRKAINKVVRPVPRPPSPDDYDWLWDEAAKKSKNAKPIQKPSPKAPQN